MKNTSPISVMLVDDHYVVRMGLTAVLQFESDIRVVAAAENGEQAVELFRRHRPDITLLDVRMPDMDGIAVLRAIRTEFPDARVIMLTTYDTEEDAYQAAQAGAAGYLLKQTGQDELVAAIRAVHAGQQIFPESLRRRIEVRASQPDLTPRQTAVLELLVKGLSNKDIARMLGVTEDGIKAHLKTIYGRLEAADRTEAVMLAIQRGIVRVD